jgi:glucan phosphoethanolaminetransferase (alkaline phosphatase superfamily)
MYKILTSAHSGWRWIVLILLIAAIGKVFMGWRKKSEFTAGDKKLAMFAMIAFHIQWTFGLVLYFISPKVAFVEGFMKNSMLRFYAMEHIVAMTIAFVLITIGHSKSKKETDGTLKFKKIFWFYFIAFIIILASIPWPFRTALGGGWF